MHALCLSQGIIQKWNYTWAIKNSVSPVGHEKITLSLVGHDKLCITDGPWIIRVSPVGHDELCITGGL